jgi:hypothetical protein
MLKYADRSCDFFHELGHIPNDKTLAMAVNSHQPHLLVDVSGYFFFQDFFSFTNQHEPQLLVDVLGSFFSVFFSPISICCQWTNI